MTDTRRDPTRKNVLMLAICQALVMSGATLVYTVSALAGYMIAEDKSLATLPLACQFVATMCSTFPASFLMRRIGRRAGFTIGQFFGIAGCVVSALAVYHALFEMLIFGGVLLGIHNAFWQYYRFAAADTASDAFRSRAISYVLAGGVIAAFVGPELSKLSVDYFAPVRFAGSYAATVFLLLIAIVMLQFIDIPKPSPEETRGGRPLAEIARQPMFIVAVLAAMFGYGVMNLVMSATPLAMAACNHDFDDTAFVIEWHTVGMFAPSFFTGHLVRRFGALNIIMAGIAIMFVCIAVNLSGIALWQFWTGLVLLGLGWNFMFIGGTTLLTETYAPSERAKVQAVNDFLVFSTVSIAVFSSVALQHLFGWTWVNVAMIAPMAIVLGATIWLRVRPATA